MISTGDIPQADSLERVRTLLEALAHSSSPSPETVGLNSRQFNYYRTAARILGLLSSGAGDQVRLTELGRRVLSTTPRSAEEAGLLKMAIRSSQPLIASVGDLFARKVDLDSLSSRLSARTHLSPATAKRRARTMIAWRNYVQAHLEPDPPGLAALARLPLNCFRLSGRARGVLKALGVNDAREFLRLTMEELERAPNCGRKTAGEIVRLANALGFELRWQSSLPLEPASRFDSHAVDAQLRTSPLRLFSLSERAVSELEGAGVSSLSDLLGADADLLPVRRRLSWLTRIEADYLVRLPAPFLSAVSALGTEVAATTMSENGEGLRPTEGWLTNPNLLQPVDKLGLPARVRTVFARVGAVFLGDVVQFSRPELLREKGLGRKSLHSLEQTFAAFGLTLGVTVRDWCQAEAERAAEELGQELTDARRSVRNALVRFETEAAVTLEDELEQLASHLLNQRKAEIAMTWFGWGERRVSLQSAADKVGLTRERVRQVLTRFRDELNALGLPLSRLKQAVSVTERSLPARLEKLAGILVRRGLVRSGTRVERVLEVAASFDLDAKIERAEIGGHTILIRPSSRLALRAVAVVAKRTVEHFGCSTVEEILALVHERNGLTLDTRSATLFLETAEGFRWLDRESGWFWLYPTKRNSLLTKIDKVLSVAHRVDVSELRAGVSRHYRTGGFAPPRRVLLEICRQLPDCEVVDGQVVLDTRPREPGDHLSETEQMLWLVFAEYGTLLSSRQFEEHATREGVNRATFWSNVANSPVLRRYDRGVYGLVGAAVSPGEVQSARIRNSRRTVVQDYGWTDSENVWVVYRVSQAAARSGVLSLPTALSKFVGGEYDLKATGSGVLCRLIARANSIWGFSPFFSRRGVEAGDCLVVEFDPTANMATVRLTDVPIYE